MAIQFRVRSGLAQGKLFDISDGSVIGRADVAITLNDPKISGRHAKIEKDRSGAWVLTDLGSTNGIRIKNKRVMQVSLAEGLVLKVGNSELEVIQKTDEETTAVPAVPLEPEVASPPTVDAAADVVAVVANSDQSPEKIDTAPKEPKKAKALTWSEYLAKFSKRAREKVENRPRPMFAFNPLLVLTVVRGIQVGTQWVLGYGPRDIGPDALEFHLFDPNSPDLAFRVTPRGAFAFYETQHPKQVKLNGSALNSETLREGDEIRIADTIIKVSYRE